MVIVGIGGAGWRFLTPSVTLKMNNASDIVKAGEGHEEGSNNRKNDGVLRTDLEKGKSEDDMRVHDDDSTAICEVEAEVYHEVNKIQRNVETIESRTLEPEAIAVHSRRQTAESPLGSKVGNSSFDVGVANEMESNHIATLVAGQQQPSPLEEQKTAPTPCQPRPLSSDQVLAHSLAYMMHCDVFSTYMLQFFLLYSTGPCYHNCKIQASSINGKAKYRGEPSTNQR